MKKISLQIYWYRNNKLLSFSPSKSINYDTFKQSCLPRYQLENLSTEPIIIFDDINNAQEISTKS